MKKQNLITLCRVSVLIALEIVLNRFCSYNTHELKIGIAFIPIALCGIMYGPYWAATAGALSDFLGAVLFPIGTYFPGFTLTAALTGLVFGLFLHRKKISFFLNILPCSVINCLILSLGLNTLWISILYGNPYNVVFITRIPQFGINLALQLALLPLLPKLSQKIDTAAKRV